MPQVTPEMLRRGRDLAAMDDALRAERDGLIFMETSQRQPPITLYAMADGEPIEMSPTIAEMAMKKRYKDGRYLFTDKQEEAPVYKMGNIKCFLHPDAPERALLEEVGLGGVTCPAEKLASLYSKRIHGSRRHRQEWETLQEYKREQDLLTERRERREQLDATLALAGKASTARRTPLEPPASIAGATFVDEGAVEVRNDCECGWHNEKNTVQGLAVHKRLHCPQREGATDAGPAPLDEAQHTDDRV